MCFSTLSFPSYFIGADRYYGIRRHSKYSRVTIYNETEFLNHPLEDTNFQFGIFMNEKLTYVMSEPLCVFGFVHYVMRC